MSNPLWRHARSNETSITVSVLKLREAALRNGCTVAQFQKATEVACENPNAVVRYLVRNAFVPANFGDVRSSGFV